MNDLVTLLRELIIMCFDLEAGEKVSLENRRNILNLAYNVQSTKSNFKIKNEIVLAINKFENELFTDSLFSYICILNLIKYLKKLELDGFDDLPEIQRFNNFIGIDEDITKVMPLSELIGNVKEAESKNFRLFTSKKSDTRYILDNDNYLWIANDNGLLKKIIPNVKYFNDSNEMRILVGLDTNGKFWKCNKDELKKEFVSEVKSYTFDRMYSLPYNKYLLITKDEVNIVVDTNTLSQKFKIVESSLTRILKVVHHNQLTIYVGDEGIVYNQDELAIRNNFIDAYIGPTCIILIDTLGAVYTRERSRNNLKKINLPEKIKTIAFEKHRIVFLSYTGNVYYQINEETNPVLIATDVDSIHEISDGVLLVSNKETRIVNCIIKIEVSTYKFHYGKLMCKP